MTELKLWHPKPVRCPICGFVFTRRWLNYLQDIAERGVKEMNRQRPRFHPKYLVAKALAVRCEECRFIYPEVWSTMTRSFVPYEPWRH
jgi:rubredoxin